MATLENLPKELLDMIANELRPCYKSLMSLSMTCQSLRPSAQIALHRDVVITAPRFDVLNDQNYDEDYCSRLEFFVRTLLGRPDLARRVRELNISINNSTSVRDALRRDYRGDSDNHVDDGWDDIMSLCENLLETASLSTGLGFNDPLWMKRIRKGKQLAFLGVVLTCTPKLQSLAIDRYINWKSFDDTYEFTPSPISFREMFGNLHRAKGFSMSWIPGLARIGSLRTNCVLAPQFFTLPNLTSLEFGFRDEQYHWHPKDLRLPRPFDANNATSLLKQMGILVDEKCLRDSRQPEGDNFYRYTRQLPDLLPNLSSLDLLVQPVSKDIFNDWYDAILRYGESYDCLVAKFRGQNIQTLKIDTSAISSARQAKRLKPIVSLTDFTKLRKIVAAQEAFFSVDEAFTVCKLPSSIEEIVIVDTTNPVSRWLKQILASIWEYPNLKSITLWTPYDPFDSPFDWRLGNQHDFPRDDEVIDSNSSTRRIDPPPQWKKDFLAASTDGSVWPDLEAAGIQMKQRWRFDLREIGWISL
ncbi:hypothetical protein N0V83_006740 [Neocucurbitaria cava]|uniref:Uncharacterized protein n=1 Tax=Neocucurbitaria cava TaxID=798079 RepID=A0A9W8Y5Z0_9PLEO|nr:hypothetical protein N0V83_006740 [Neocucurbitaria cava]